jgi:stage II sporulation protein D
MVLKGQGLVIEGELSAGWKEIVRDVSAAAFEVSGNRIRLKGSPIRALQYRVTDSSRFVSWGRKRWRGALALSRDRNGISLVNHMKMELYLVGLVNGEISSSWPEEAVKAQVVAARTYAMTRMAEADGVYDLKTDVSDQVYAGVAAEDNRAARAVNATRGLALYNGKELVPAYYHSSCGGSTSDISEVWGIESPSLTGVTCGQCGDSPRSSWEVPMKMGEVSRAIKDLFPRARKITTLGVHHRTTDGRVTALFTDTAGGRILLDADDFRRTVGYFKLPSTRFRIYSENGMIVFRGGGFGHGIGLCQWGSRGMALENADYKQILKTYYPGAELRTVYE